MHTLCALSVHQTHPVLDKKGTPATKSHDGGIHLIVPSHSQKVKCPPHPGERFFLSPWPREFEGTWQSQKRYGKSHLSTWHEIANVPKSIGSA